MLVRLAVENFYSFKEKQVFDLRIPKTTPLEPGRFLDVPAQTGIRVPKVVAIFGPNAAGKSTLLRALEFLDRFITRSFTRFEAGQPMPLRPFAADDCVLGQTSFELEFAISEVVIGEQVHRESSLYRYELKIQHSKKTNFVAWESLKRATRGEKFRLLFERGGKENEMASVRPAAEFKVKADDPRLSVRPNVSVISSLFQFAHPEAVIIRDAFNTMMTNSIEVKLPSREAATKVYSRNDAQTLKQLNELIKTIDLGIESVFMVERDGQPVPMFRHYGLNEPQRLEDESQGTKNFYGLFPTLALTLGLGGTAIVDEIDSDIHPLLMPEIIRWYLDPIRNPYGAQLVMACHNASLLDELRKEEVFFVDKRRDGASEIYGLREINGVRRDTNIYAKYLGGSFGAIPQIG